MDKKSRCKEHLSNACIEREHSPFFDTDAYYRMLSNDLSVCYDLRDLKLNVLTTVKELGFSDFIFIRLERQWQVGSSRGLLHSLSKEMMDEYLEHHLHSHDLLLSYGRVNSQPIFASQVYDYIDNAPFEMALTINNRQLRKFYRRYHYAEHLAVPANAINGNGNVLLILTHAGKSKEEIQKAAVPAIAACRVLCKAIDNVTTRKFKSTFIDVKDNPLMLTPKSLAMLQALVHMDASITDIAQTLNISPITAHQHASAARKALGASTNIGAVVKALKVGLIRGIVDHV